MSLSSELYREPGSLFSLEEQRNIWQKVGNGEIVLLHSLHNPNSILLCLECTDDSAANHRIMFQFMPSVVRQQLIFYIRGQHTRLRNTHKLFVLAVVFTQESYAEHFLQTVTQAKVERGQYTSSMSIKRRRRRPHSPSTFAITHQVTWDCKLCMRTNPATVTECVICLTPHPSLLRKMPTVSDTLSLPHQPSTVIMFPIIDDGKVEEEEEEEEEEEDLDKHTVMEELERITDEHYDGDRQMGEILILCHLTFTTSQNLLSLLQKRWRQSASMSHGWTIQIKVGNLLTHWMKTYFDIDFGPQPLLLKQLQTMVSSLENSQTKKNKVLIAKIGKTFKVQAQEYSAARLREEEDEDFPGGLNRMRSGSQPLPFESHLELQKTISGSGGGGGGPKSISPFDSISPTIASLDEDEETMPESRKLIGDISKYKSRSSPIHSKNATLNDILGPSFPKKKPLFKNTRSSTIRLNKRSSAKSTAGSGSGGGNKHFIQRSNTTFGSMSFGGNIKIKTLKYIQEKPERIAEQISLMDFEIFRKIHPRECLGQAWKKKDKKERAPNVLAFVDQFNNVARWAQVWILIQTNRYERVKVMRKCIKLALAFKEMSNFSSACAVSAALNSTPVFRLKDSWNQIPKNLKVLFDDLKETFSPGGSNWGKLRNLHKSAVPPAILHTGLFLQDLFAIEETACDKKNGKINSRKLLVVHERISTLIMYQQQQYIFEKNSLMTDMIGNDFQQQEHKYTDINMLFDLSDKARNADKGK